MVGNCADCGEFHRYICALRGAIRLRSRVGDSAFLLQLAVEDDAGLNRLPQTEVRARRPRLQQFAGAAAIHGSRRLQSLQVLNHVIDTMAGATANFAASTSGATATRLPEYRITCSVCDGCDGRAGAGG